MNNRLLIGDNIDGIGRKLAEKISFFGYETDCCSNDTDTILSRLKKEKYSSVVLFITNIYQDNCIAIRRIRQEYPDITFFVLSYVRSFKLECEMCELGVTAYILLPASIDYICHILVNVLYNSKETVMLPDLADFIYKKGFTHSGAGAEYLCVAVEECIKSPELLADMTESLYPLIARKRNCSARSVERMLRHLCENAGAKSRQFRGYAGDYPMSNSDIIAALADEYVRIYNIY